MTQTPGNGAAPVAIVPAAPANAPVVPAPAAPAASAQTTTTQSKIQEFNNTPLPPMKQPPLKPKGIKEPTKEDLGPEGPATPLGEQSKPFSDAIEKTNGFFQKISITGGLAIAFFVLIGAIWLLIPTASGYTRAQLLWFTIIGSTRLVTDPEPNPGSSPQDVTIPDQQPGPIPLTLQTQAPIPTPNGPATSTNGFVDLTALDFGGDW